jgi:hypothetical protein
METAVIGRDSIRTQSIEKHSIRSQRVTMDVFDRVVVDLVSVNLNGALTGAVTQIIV